MAITSTVLKLYKGVEIAPGYQVAYTSSGNQKTYFASKLYKTFSDYSFHRHKENVYNVAISNTEARQCNYLSFNNNGLEYYCAIVDYEYINENTTALIYQVDWYQTLGINHTKYDPCIIARQTLPSGFSKRDIYSNQEPVEIAYTHYVGAGEQFLLNPGSIACIITEPVNLDTTWNTEFGFNYFATMKHEYLYTKVMEEMNKYIDQLSAIRIVKDNGVVSSSADRNSLTAWIGPVSACAGLNSCFCAANKGNMVYGIYLLPFELFNIQDGGKQVKLNYSFDSSDKASYYPYSQIILRSPNGQVKIYKPELFKNMGNINFDLRFSFAAGPELLISPIDYNYQSGPNYCEGLTIANFPPLTSALNISTAYGGQQYTKFTESEKVLKTGLTAAGTAAGIALTGGALAGESAAATSAAAEATKTAEMTTGANKMTALEKAQAMQNKANSTVANEKATMKNLKLNAGITGINQAISLSNSTYNPSTTGLNPTGICPLSMENSKYTPTVQVVHLDSFGKKQLYDYINYYGNSFNIYGKPCITNLASGVSGHAYVQTANFRCFAPNLEATNFIKSIFDGGCYFKIV